jgi:hypothetical protein
MAWMREKGYLPLPPDKLFDMCCRTYNEHKQMPQRLSSSSYRTEARVTERLGESFVLLFCFPCIFSCLLGRRRRPKCYNKVDIWMLTFRHTRRVYDKNSWRNRSSDISDIIWQAPVSPLKHSLLKPMESLRWEAIVCEERKTAATERVIFCPFFTSYLYHV